MHFLGRMHVTVQRLSLMQFLLHAGGYEILKGKLPEFIVPDLKGFAVSNMQTLAHYSICSMLLNVWYVCS